MARIPKSIRMDEELISLIDKKGKGVDFTDKLHNSLYFYFKEEAAIKERIKDLEKKEKQLRNSIAGLEEARVVSKNLFLQVANLFDAIGKGSQYQIEGTMKNLNEMIDRIKKTL